MPGPNEPEAPAAGPLRPGPGLVPVVLAGLLLGVLAQGARGIYRPDEGRYTAVALRMLQTGNWLHPQLDHEHPQHAKPPLTCWAIAASVAAFGASGLSVRSPNALAFLLTLLALWVAAKRVLPRRPWLPVALHSVCLFPRLAQDIVTTDTWLALVTTTAACGFIAWRYDPRRPPRLLVLMWVGLALGFLTKGPPALLPLLGIAIFTAWEDGPGALRRLWSGRGALLFLVLGLGWYAAVAISRAGLATYFIHDEVQARILGGSHHRNPSPLYILQVYLPLLAFGTFPWVWQTWRGVARGCATLRDPAQGPSRFLVVWIAGSLAVPFAASSRLPLYLLQVFPALILLASLHAPEVLLRGRRSAAWVGAFVLLGFAGFVAARWLPVSSDARPLAEAIRAQVPFAPREVLFLRKPYRGLALYLDCEVEEVGLAARIDEGNHRFQGLAEEMAEDEPRQVVCVEKAMEDDFLSVARRDALSFLRVGRAERYVLYVPQRDVGAVHGSRR